MKFKKMVLLLMIGVLMILPSVNAIKIENKQVVDITDDKEDFNSKTKEEIFKEIEETENKILIVDKIIGNKHVKYWEHVINNVFMKGDSILLHIDIENGDILEYERSWTGDHELVLSDSADDVFEPNNYFWEQLVVFPDENDCTNFYTFYEEQDYPVVCWEVRHTDGTTIMYDLDGEQVGHGIPTPSLKGFSLSGYHEPDWPDPWINFRQNADSWFTKWCTSTISLSLPTPATISSYIQDSNVEYFYELAHGTSTYFKADSNNCYYSSTLQQDMVDRQPMKFAFIGSCEGMGNTGLGTFSYEFRKDQMTNTVTVGYISMTSCPGWPNALSWQNYMFEKMDEGNTIKSSFDAASAQYPTIASCVVFVGDENLKSASPVKTADTCNLEKLCYDSSSVVMTLNKNLINMEQCMSLLQQLFSSINFSEFSKVRLFH